MIALDTNIIVRFLTKDDEQQFQKAYRIFNGAEKVYISTTVILETEWVLRFTYRFPPDRIIFALSGLLGLENVSVENENRVISALQWHRQGMDFSDALHLASSLQAGKFASFDRKLVKKATGLNTGVVLLEP
jgi:predicted nucleic-acid-binding protein